MQKHSRVSQAEPVSEAILLGLIVDFHVGVGFGLPNPAKFNCTGNRNRRKDHYFDIHAVLILDFVKG